MLNKKKLLLKQVGEAAASLTDDCDSQRLGIRKSTSAVLSSYNDPQITKKRSKPMAVLEMLRSKLKPSSKTKSSSHENGGIHGTVSASDEYCASNTNTDTGDCTVDSLHDGSRCYAGCNSGPVPLISTTRQSLSSLTEHTNDPSDICDLNDTTDGITANLYECLSRDGDGTSTDESASKLATPTSATPTSPCCMNSTTKTIPGGLVLSQLTNGTSIGGHHGGPKCHSLYSDDKAPATMSLPLSPSVAVSDVETASEDLPPVKWTLAKELMRLSRYGWYWGPVSREEAEEKLADQPEGAFLVRDSTDDRYLFSLSFRSSGRTLHTRVEYCNGEFSFYAQPRSDSYHSMAELIERCVIESQSGIYCYSRGAATGVGSQSYPVKLTRPVSRFSQVRSLQYLCRFVIRQHTRVDHIQSLPLPVSVKGWLKENQY